MSQIVLLTLDEVALRLRCKVAKVQRLCLSGDLTFLQGRPLLVPEEALNAYITGKLKHGTKSAAPGIVDSRSDDDKAYDELEITLEAIYKRNGNKMSMTAEIRKLLEPFKDRPEMVAARRQATIDWHAMKQREAASVERKALALAKAQQEEQRRAAAERRRIAVEERKRKAAQPKTP